MKLELDIRDDTKLRKMIRTMIEGQVRGILREDTQKIVDEFLVDLSDKRIEEMARGAISSAVTRTLKTELPAIVKDEVERIVGKLAPDMIAKAFPKAVREGVQTVINRLVQYNEG